MKILIHCPSSAGGIAEYVHCQAKSFVKQGHKVLLLCPGDYLQGRSLDYSALRIYGSLTKQSKSRNVFCRTIGILRRASIYLISYWQLLFVIISDRPDFILFDSYIEYLAPLWVWPHVLLAKYFGLVYVANLHDPVRDFVLGPKWWHDLSVKMGYWPFKYCVVHQRLPHNDLVPPHVKVFVVPHGLYDHQTTSTLSSDKIRQNWGFSDHLRICLSFGFIRDNKNLDLLIRALPNVPQVALVVMGSSQSSMNKPISFYQDLATTLGVSSRVIFNETFVPDEDIPVYFAASDFLALTYNKTFHSQSGVLNLAVRARRRVLASSGDSPLRSSVIRFKLGEFVQPDDQEALERGMLTLVQDLEEGATSNVPDWQGYEEYASWETNTATIASMILALASRRSNDTAGRHVFPNVMKRRSRM